MSEIEANGILFKAAKDIRSGFLDGACNLSGVSHSYIDVVRAVNALVKDTQERNSHWAIKHYLDKMANLSGIDTTSHGALADEYNQADKFYHDHKHAFEKVIA